MPTSIAQLWVPRVELHLIYNTIVFIPMVIAMYYHMFPPAAEEAQMRMHLRRPSARGDRLTDWLRVPLLGRFLRWRHSRTAMQLPLFAVAVAMIVHGLFGPQLAPRNLATLLTWVHYRGLLVLVLLGAGNLFCMACPFMLPRELARRFLKPRAALAAPAAHEVDRRRPLRPRPLRLRAVRPLGAPPGGRPG